MFSSQPTHPNPVQKQIESEQTPYRYIIGTVSIDLSPKDMLKNWEIGKNVKEN